MIEKLKPRKELMPTGEAHVCYGADGHYTLEDLLVKVEIPLTPTELKINEIIDALNALEKEKK